ncbi:MAG: type II CAAX endopeptidase family protein [Syntrophomonadaceae bacterium]|nr:type II CAAX endopeptidase family protein [Syntrophomonadaceae bacterium]MDD3889556.1 type II CAAX endopeptidase family protein [Syntrophomonadaceae bacterium]MDD4549098.1 type II CAAX endopeptidase family protein [Syntrophomonadaceae bacterium]
MLNEIKQPRWGFVEIVLTYGCILAISVVYALSKARIAELVRVLGLPDIILTYFSIGFIIQFISTVLLVLAFTMLINKAAPADLGIKKPHRGTDYFRYGVVGGIILMLVMIILSIPINYLHPEIEPQVYEDILRAVHGFPQFILIFIMGAVLAPLSEELFYRGMIYPVFRKYLGPGWGMVVAGLVFGLAHWDIWRLIPLSIGGALLCLIYEKTGSIFISALAHGVWNGVMSIFIYSSIIRIV